MAETLIVAYRFDDPMRFVSETINRVVRAGRCGTCGANCYVNESGADAIRKRDCAIVCRECRAHAQFHPMIISGL